MDLIVRAFAAMPERRLVVIGDGPEMPRLREAAAPNVTLMGFQPDAVLRDHLQRARAFVFAAEEDFGILPVEAQACGTPVIAYGKGGVLDSVKGLSSDHGPTPTGVFFEAQTVPALRDAVDLFERAVGAISPLACRAQAERFSAARFRTGFMDVVRGVQRDEKAAHADTRRQPALVSP